MVSDEKGVELVVGLSGSMMGILTLTVLLFFNSLSANGQFTLNNTKTYKIEVTNPAKTVTNETLEKNLATNHTALHTNFTAGQNAANNYA